MERYSHMKYPFLRFERTDWQIYYCGFVPLTTRSSNSKEGNFI